MLAIKIFIVTLFAGQYFPLVRYFSSTSNIKLQKCDLLGSITTTCSVINQYINHKIEFVGL